MKQRNLWLGLGLATLLGCNVRSSIEGVRLSEIPTPELRSDYELFSQRCSKCHGLARPLNAGDKSDEFWQRYVSRMRRQPESGIAVEDEPPILRFLHYYSDRVRNGSGTGIAK